MSPLELRCSWWLQIWKWCILKEWAERKALRWSESVLLMNNVKTSSSSWFGSCASVCSPRPSPPGIHVEVCSSAVLTTMPTLATSARTSHKNYSWEIAFLTKWQNYRCLPYETKSFHRVSIPRWWKKKYPKWKICSCRIQWNENMDWNFFWMKKLTKATAFSNA